MPKIIREFEGCLSVLWYYYTQAEAEKKKEEKKKNCCRGRARGRRLCDWGNTNWEELWEKATSGKSNSPEIWNPANHSPSKFWRRTEFAISISPIRQADQPFFYLILRSIDCLIHSICVSSSFKLPWLPL